MDANAAAGPQDVLEGLRRAMNARDLDALVAHFDPAYRSEQPAHPDRAFGGREQVRENWGAMFAGMPDFRADLLRSAVDGEVAWAEWTWRGTRPDGSQLEMLGVTLFGVRDGLIAWARLYMEPVEREGRGIGTAVRRLSGTSAA